MKIIYIVSEYPKVSHSFVRREILALEQLGHEICRVSVRGWDLHLADAADVLERSHTLYVLKNGFLSLAVATLGVVFTKPFLFISALRLAMKMSRKAEKPLPFHLVYLMEACWISLQPQLADGSHIHAHFGTNPTEVAALLGILMGLPFSFTAHGPDEFDKPQALHMGTKVAMSAFTVCVSSYGRSQMMRWSHQADWHKIKVVHCGLDAKFLEAEALPPPAQNRLVCVGRLSGQKGQLLLLEAAAKLKDQGVVFELILAGDGEMRSQIESAIQTLGLAQFVSITGWIDGTEVKRLLQTSKALVLPSFAEGLPVVIMEAMAISRPVISTYIAGIPELVRHGQEGWLVPAGDVSGLSNAMHACLTATPEQLTAMGAAAKARVKNRHDMMTEANKLLVLIDSHKPTQQHT